MTTTIESLTRIERLAMERGADLIQQHDGTWGYRHYTIHGTAAGRDYGPHETAELAARAYLERFYPNELR